MELNNFILDAANDYHRNLGGFIPAYCRYLSKNYDSEQIRTFIALIRNPKYEEEVENYFPWLNEAKEDE